MRRRNRPVAAVQTPRDEVTGETGPAGRAGRGWVVAADWLVSASSSGGAGGAQEKLWVGAGLEVDAIGPGLLLPASLLAASPLPLCTNLLPFFPSICPSFGALSFPRLAPSISPLSSVGSSLLSECGEDEEFILKPSVPQDAPPVTQTF